MNRLTRYCDGLIETAWLAVIFVTPVFFNIDSSVTFEGPKIMLLRSIVLVALAAWGVKLISEGGWRFERLAKPASLGQFLRIPLVLPVALLLVAYLSSTLFSISPTTSLNGSLYRARSTYTLVSYVFLFVILAANLRRRDQVERLLVLLAVASFVVDVYALLQKFSLDPHILQIKNVDVLERVVSTVGHPIFTGAFLGMSIFVLLGRAVLAFQSCRARRVTLAGDLTRAVIYSSISALNILALWYTASRGPLLGVFAGLAIFVILILLYWRLRRTLAVVFTLGLLSAACLVLLNIPNGPLESLRQSSLMGPLGRIFELQGGSGRTRVLIWTGMARLMSSHAPVLIPGEIPANGSPDRWNVIRPLVGYGPETIRLVYEAYYDPEIYLTESHTVSFDSSHNEFWDALGFFGLLGVIAEFGLFLSLSYFSLKWLDLIRLPFERKLYWGLSLGAGLLTAVVLVLISQARYLGLGVPLAVLAGPAGILIYRVFRPIPETETRLEPWRTLTLISFLAAVFSHYIELLSGIAVVATVSLFWILGALIFVVGQFPLSVVEVPAANASVKSSSRSRSASKVAQGGWIWAKDLRRVGVNLGALVLVMTTLGAMFIVVPQVADSAIGTLLNSLTSLSGSEGPVSYGIFGLFFASVLLAGLLLQFESDSLAGRKPRWVDLLISLGLALVVSAFFWLIRANQLVAIKQAQAGGDTAGFSTGIVALLTVYCVVLLLLLLTWAAALSAEGKHTFLTARPGLASVTGSVLIPLFLLGFAVYANLRPMQADIFFSLAKNIVNPAQKRTVMAMYARALELAPAQDEYFLTAGETYYRNAISETEVANKDFWIKLSLEKLQRACQLDPLVLDNMMALARSYRLWGQVSQDSALKTSRFSQAETYYKSALSIRTGRIDYLLDWAGFSIEQSDFPAAQEKIKAALAVDASDNLSYGLSGKAYLAQAETEKDPAARMVVLNKAVQAFQKQAEILSQQGGNPTPALIDLGTAYQGLQQYEQARAAYLKAVEHGAGENQWKLFFEIAQISGLLDNPAGLRQYLQKAIESAPEAEKPALQAKLNSLVP